MNTLLMGRPEAGEGSDLEAVDFRSSCCLSLRQRSAPTEKDNYTVINKASLALIHYTASSNPVIIS